MARFGKWTTVKYTGLFVHDRQSAYHDGKQEETHPERLNENFIITDIKKVDGKFTYETLKDETGANLQWQDERIAKYVMAKIGQRLNEVHAMNRKDVIHVVSLMFTIPPELKNAPKKEQKKCLMSAVRFMRQLTGEKNFISATFHFHEVSPHVTYDFVPVVKDKKTGKEKCCCKELLTKSFLQGFHGRLGAYIDDALGYHVSVETGVTKQNGGNQTINWLKEQSHKQEIAKKNKQIKELENEKNYYRMQLIRSRKLLDFIKEDNSALFNKAVRYSSSIGRPTAAELHEEYSTWIEGKRKAGRASAKNKNKIQENERR